MLLTGAIDDISLSIKSYNNRPNMDDFKMSLNKHPNMDDYIWKFLDSNYTGFISFYISWKLIT